MSSGSSPALRRGSSPALRRKSGVSFGGSTPTGLRINAPRNDTAGLSPRITSSSSSSSSAVETAADAAFNLFMGTSQATAAVEQRNGWGLLDKHTGLMEMKTQSFGMVRYKGVTESAVQNSSFALKKPWTMIEREAERRAEHLPPPTPKGANDPNHPRSFAARLEYTCMGLQTRGLGISIPPSAASDGKWAQLHILEKRLKAAEERENRATRMAHIATSEQRLGVMKEYRAERAKTALIKAARDGSTEAALKAVDLGAPSDLVFHNGETLLTTLVHMRATTDIVRAIQAGSDPQRTNAYGWTPLMLAIAIDSEPCVVALLSAGVNPNRGRWFGVGHARAGSPPPPLIKQGESLQWPTPWAEAPLGRDGDYLTPAMLAVALGLGGCMGALLGSRDIDLRASNNKGRTVLHFAARFRRLDFTRLLCQSRLDPDVLDVSGFTPIDWLRAAARERIILVATGREKEVPGDDDGVLSTDVKTMAIGIGEIISAITGRMSLSFVETCILEALEEAARRMGAHSKTQTMRVMKMMGVNTLATGSEAKAEMFTTALTSVRQHLNTLVLTLRGADEQTLLSLGKIVRGLGTEGTSLLTLLETPRMGSTARLESMHDRRRAAHSDDEFDDDVIKLPLTIGTTKSASEAKAEKASRGNTVCPDFSDFPVYHILSEKPPTDKLGDAVRERSKKSGGTEKSIASDPNAYPATLAKLSHAGASTVLRALPPAFFLSPASGRALAVSVIPSTKLARITNTVPLTVATDPNLVDRGLSPLVGLPLAVRERNALTVLVEGIMQPIISMFNVNTSFNFMSPEAEAFHDFAHPTDPRLAQVNILSQMRGALVLYHKQTLDRLGELAAPVVLRDMSTDAELLGDFGPSTDPCGHCGVRRAVVRCINCAAAHCERCTLWIHKQTAFRSHRCRPLLPKGLSEGIVMTRQARAEEAAAQDRVKFESFPTYVERLRKVLRRVKKRIAAAAAVADENERRNSIGYWGAVKALGPGGGGGRGKVTIPTTTGNFAPSSGTAVESPPVYLDVESTAPTSLVRASRVTAYRDWINAIPGAHEPHEILPSTAKAVTDSESTPYEPPPLVLGKLLQMNPNIGKWMGITLTPLFAPAPEGLPKPPDAPEFAAKALEIQVREERERDRASSDLAHHSSSIHTTTTTTASTSSFYPPSSAITANGTSVGGESSSYFEMPAELPRALEAPNMVYLRPKIDGSSGFQTREDLVAAKIALDASRAAIEAELKAKLEIRWEAMLAAKKGALKAGKTGSAAYEVAHAAAEAIFPSISVEPVALTAEQVAAADGSAEFEKAVKEGRAFYDEDPRTAGARQEAIADKAKNDILMKYTESSRRGTIEPGSLSGIVAARRNTMIANAARRATRVGFDQMGGGSIMEGGSTSGLSFGHLVQVEGAVVAQMNNTVKFRDALSAKADLTARITTMNSKLSATEPWYARAQEDERLRQLAFLGATPEQISAQPKYDAHPEPGVAARRLELTSVSAKAAAKSAAASTAVRPHIKKAVQAATRAAAEMLLKLIDAERPVKLSQGGGALLTLFQSKDTSAVLATPHWDPTTEAIAEHSATGRWLTASSTVLHVFNPAATMRNHIGGDSAHIVSPRGSVHFSPRGSISLSSSALSPRGSVTVTPAILSPAATTSRGVISPIVSSRSLVSSIDSLDNDEILRADTARAVITLEKSALRTTAVGLTRREVYPDIIVAENEAAKGEWQVAMPLFAATVSKARAIAERAASEYSDFRPPLDSKLITALCSWARAGAAHGESIARQAEAAHKVAALLFTTSAAENRTAANGGLAEASFAAAAATEADEARRNADALSFAAAAAWDAAAENLIYAHGLAASHDKNVESIEFELIAQAAIIVLLARGNAAGALKLARLYAATLECRASVMMLIAKKAALGDGIDFLITKPTTWMTGLDSGAASPEYPDTGGGESRSRSNSSATGGSVKQSRSRSNSGVNQSRSLAFSEVSIASPQHTRSRSNSDVSSVNHQSNANIASITDGVFLRAIDALTDVRAAVERLVMTGEDTRAPNIAGKPSPEALLAFGWERSRELAQRDARLARAHASAAAAVAKAEAQAKRNKASERPTLRPHVSASIPEVLALTAVPRWARWLHKCAQRVAAAASYVDFLVAIHAFQLTPISQRNGPVARAAATHIVKYFITPAHVLPALASNLRRRVAAAIGFRAGRASVYGSPTAAEPITSELESSLQEAAHDAAAVLVEHVMPTFLSSHHGGCFIIERILTMGLPSWSVPQVAQLTAPARLVAVTWVQKAVRGFLIRRRLAAAIADGRLRQSNENLTLTLARIAAEAEANRERSRLASEAAARESAAVAAAAARAVEEQLAFEASVAEAVAEAERVAAAALLEAKLLQEKAARQAEAEDEAAYSRALAAAAAGELPPPPPQTAHDTYGESLFAAAAAEDIAASAAAAKEADRRERERQAVAPFAASYLREVSGARADKNNSLHVFNALIAAGESEEVAWEGFRKSEAAAQALEAALAEAERVGLALPSHAATDTMSIEAAVAVARGSAMRAHLDSHHESARQLLATVMIQRMLRHAHAKRKVARKANRHWLPVADEASGSYYYINVKSGVSTWTLPKILPTKFVTLKAVCAACASALATAQCVVCDEAFCAPCLNAVHALRVARSRHYIFYLPEAGSPSSAFHAHTALAPLTTDVERVIPGLGLLGGGVNEVDGGVGIPARLAFAKSIEAAFAGPSDGLCLGCDRRIGTRYCGSCEVLYCAGCWPAMHASGNRTSHRPWMLWKATHHPDGREIIA